MAWHINANNTFTLKSNDGQEFSVARRALNKFGISPLDDRDEPLPCNIRGPIMELVVEWLNHHANDPVVQNPSTMAEPSNWDKDLLDVDGSTLKEITAAAANLHIQLLFSACLYAAGKKSVEETFKMHGMQYSKQEQQHDRDENDENIQCKE